MTCDPNIWFGQSLDTLILRRNERVWSILVTIFGDLARHPGDWISGACLTRLTEPMGIKPEAMRVALHRLRGDGWITSERVGRSSRYRLTPSGLAQSDAASPRIYGAQPQPPDVWHIVLTDPAITAPRGETEKQWRARDYVALIPGAYLGKGPAQDAAPDHFVLSGTLGTIPDWLRNQTAPPGVAQSYNDLETALDRFLATCTRTPPLTPLHIAILRVVIVHHWRRALLAHPDLPAELLPQGWRGFACRDKVAEALSHLPRPDLAALDDTRTAA